MLYIAETMLGILLAPGAGLGRFIVFYTFRGDISLAGVVGLALLGLLFYVILEQLERLSLIHISEPTRPLYISYAVFCLKKKIQLK